MLAIATLALAGIFSLAACSAPGDAASQQSDQSANQTAAPENDSANSEPAPDNKLIRVSTTTSVNDSGLLPYLQPEFEKDTGYTLEVTSAGTGAAIEKGRTGDADVLLVHNKTAEEEFVTEGFGEERVPFMSNYFVIVGPENDPAAVKGKTTASEAFKSIADTQSTFISRGDDSGTHKAEVKIWDAAGLMPNPDVDEWYISAGAGMGAVLNMASERQAYALTDKATYLSHELKDTLSLLMAESEDMKNTYSMIAVSPDKWPDTNIEGADAFIEWMKSDKATELINNYGVAEYGEQLFYTDGF